MPKRKKLSPALPHVQIGMRAGVVVRQTLFMNGAEVPSLLPGWESHIEEHLHTESLWVRAAGDIVGSYIAGRVAVRNAVPLDVLNAALKVMPPSAEQRRWLAREGLKHDTPWQFLVTALAALFEETGRRATAAKSSEKPSAFVEFVWAVMKHAVPKELSEHASSPDAMAAAISNLLKARR